MKILESCKQKIENRMPRVRVDRGWAEAEWHHAITPHGGGLTIARDSPALLQVWLGRVPFVFVRVLELGSERAYVIPRVFDYVRKHDWNHTRSSRRDGGTPSPRSWPQDVPTCRMLRVPTFLIGTILVFNPWNHASSSKTKYTGIWCIYYFDP